jgi:hypothetical protein
MPKLPTTVYVKWENEDDPDERYLSADQIQERLAEKGEIITIGEYRLVKKRNIELRAVEKLRKGEQ